MSGATHAPSHGASRNEGRVSGRQAHQRRLSSAFAGAQLQIPLPLGFSLGQRLPVNWALHMLLVLCITSEVGLQFAAVIDAQCATQVSFSTGSVLLQHRGVVVAQQARGRAKTHIAEVAVDHAWACQSSCSLHSGEGCRLWPQLHASCGVAGLVLLFIDVDSSLLLQSSISLSAVDSTDSMGVQVVHGRRQDSSAPHHSVHAFLIPSLVSATH